MKSTSLITGFAALLLAGCQSGSGTNPHVPTSYYSNNALERYDIDVQTRTVYLEVNMQSRDGQLRIGEIANVKAFVADYKDRGHGKLVIALPKNAPNPRLAVEAVAFTREAAWQAGVDYDEIKGTAYDAFGEDDAPMILAFTSYEALTPNCPSIGTIDIANAVSNNDLPSLGCAVRTNMAAMAADPGDFLAQRVLAEGDPDRRLGMFENWREGKPTGAERIDDERGAISGAIN
ncbi:MAG: CpaD family pilus assembly lipoprotein [Henriciella sp.]|nr:CpaD family pilus assembly lipoprotein [Henriciella sp.]